MNYSSPLNPFTSDKRSRIASDAASDADVLLAMRRKIERAVEKGLHEAELLSLELELLNPELTMAALRKQFDPAILQDSFVDGFWAARKLLWSQTGEDFPEPPMDAEPTQQLEAAE